jgi:hypothetical protein
LMQALDLNYWVFDWKTAAKLHGDQDTFLEIDDQITGYCAALYFLEVPVSGFIYHAQRKAFPQPPEPNKSGRRYKGALFSVNKTQPTTYELYLDTVRENDPEGLASGAYNDFLLYIQENPPQFYERFEQHRNEAELKSALHDLWLEAQDITDPGLRIYRNARYFGCNSCAFRNPCIGQNRGEDYQYTLDTMYDKRTTHYWEEAVPSTETKGGQ